MCLVDRLKHNADNPWACHTKQKGIDSHAITTQHGLCYTSHLLTKGIPIPTRENNPYFILRARNLLDAR